MELVVPSSRRVTPIEASSSSSRDAETGEANRECPICLQEGTLMITSCQHSFCRSCLTKYVESQPGDSAVVHCPMCRQTLPPDDLPPGVKPMGSPAQVPAVREPCTCRRIVKWLIIVNASVAFFFLGIMFFIVDSPKSY